MNHLTCDVIVVGAGPNGLVSASYLSALGLKVIVVERYVETGGGLVTQEISGFKFNHHATYMLMAELLPPYRDHNLSEKGVRFIRPEQQVSFLFRDGTSLTLYTDIDRSAKSVEAFAPGDGVRFKTMMEEFQKMWEVFLYPATFYPPAPPLDQTEQLHQAGKLGERIAEISDLSPLDLLKSYGFSNPKLLGGLLYLACLFGIYPEEGGIGFLVPIYITRLLNNALVAGGSHQLSSSLRRTAEEYGAKIITSHEVKQFLVEDGKVVGVELDDGRTIHGRAVLSTLNPVQTFRELLKEEYLYPGIREVVEKWEWEHISFFITHMGYVGDPPRYERYPKKVDRSLLVVMGYESPEDVIAHYQEVEEGKRERMGGHVTVPSLFDPLMAPNHVPFGTHHVLRWESFAPYDGDWSVEGKREYQERCLSFLGEYAPNMKKVNRRVTISWSPKDIENHLPTMRRGSIKHGAYISLQMGYNRPFPEASGYRTPVEGLYVGGASVHPGGMIIAGPGYNSARVIAEDFHIPWKWGELPEVEKALRDGYLCPGKEE